ncbi:hypothetical protein C809_00206 [Lachnospiraceae bacterium MD335]|nr:hypothetical protein C809_00206 [Lachnospiraceae bacterium MD335]
MESLRDVKRAMEREIKKGSCPLKFDRLEFGGAPFQIITSEEKLDEVLAYLLRVKSFRQFAEKTIINNVYMDLDMLCRKPQFKRTHSILEREGIYARVQKYKKRLQLDYDSGLCLETVQCLFTLPEGEAEKYRMIYDGKETYKSPQYHKLCKVHALQSFRLSAERKGYSETRKHDYCQHQRGGAAIRRGFLGEG